MSLSAPDGPKTPSSNQVSIPVVTANRINTPEVADDVIREGCADMVSMARPLLAGRQLYSRTARGVVWVRIHRSWRMRFQTKLQLKKTRRAHTFPSP
jgi:2,4-dienoyl-CoA reductase-like NADH-dependent reductase (Old Yellow Enzyme family)